MAEELRRSRTGGAAECAKALFRLEPGNPRAMQDILEIYGNDRYDCALRELVPELIDEHKGNLEAEVSIGFHYGMRLIEMGNLRSAVQTLRDAKKAAQSISRDHPALTGIGEMPGGDSRRRKRMKSLQFTVVT